VRSASSICSRAGARGRLVGELFGVAQPFFKGCDLPLGVVLGAFDGPGGGLGVGVGPDRGGTAERPTRRADAFDITRPPARSWW
jgi:hypothetical protein